MGKSPQDTKPAGDLTSQLFIEPPQWQDVVVTGGISPGDLLLLIPIYGEALAGDGIHSGDLVIVNLNYSVSDLIPGILVLANCASGLMVLHLYIKPNQEIILTPSNGHYRALAFREDQVSILGVIIQKIG